MITFEVIGTPEALARPRAYRLPRNGGVRVYQPKASWQQMVALVAAQQPQNPSSAAVTLDLSFRMPRPKSLPKRVEHHTKKPDLDNMVKATVDGLVPALLADDRGIVGIVATKRYARPEEAPGAIITIRELDAAQAGKGKG